MQETPEFGNRFPQVAFRGMIVSGARLPADCAASL